MDFDAAIFDMDGTILDSMGFWMNAGALYIESLGKTPEPDLGKKVFDMTMSEGCAYLSERYNIKKSEEEIIRGIDEVLSETYRTRIQAKPGAIDFLHELKKRGVPMAIATNTDRVLFTPCLERLGILNLFDGIFTCSECFTSKTQPHIYYIAAESLETPVERTLIFEDALYAIRTAKNAGFKTVGIFDEHSAQDTERIKKYSTVYCTNYEEVRKAVLS